MIDGNGQQSAQLNGMNIFTHFLLGTCKFTYIMHLKRLIQVLTNSFRLLRNGDVRKPLVAEKSSFGASSDSRVIEVLLVSTALFALPDSRQQTRLFGRLNSSLKSTTKAQPRIFMDISGYEEWW